MGAFTVHQHFSELWRKWIVYLTGPASVVLMFAGTSPDTPKQSIIMWVAGYVCLLFSAGVIIFNLHARVKDAGEGGLVAERKRQARMLLLSLNDDETQALKQLLILHQMTGDYIRQHHSNVDFTRLNQGLHFPRSRLDYAI
jgi:hypothetical protein